MTIKDALKIIESAMPIKANSEKTRLLHEMCELIKKRTSNFKKPDGISSDKVDLKPLLNKEKISPSEWKTHKGSFRRSEMDSVSWLAELLKEKSGETGTETERRKRIRIAEAEAQAIQVQLELLRLKN